MGDGGVSSSVGTTTAAPPFGLVENAMPSSSSSSPSPSENASSLNSGWTRGIFVVVRRLWLGEGGDGEVIIYTTQRLKQKCPRSSFVWI